MATLNKPPGKDAVSKYVREKAKRNARVRRKARRSKAAMKRARMSRYKPDLVLRRFPGDTVAVRREKPKRETWDRGGGGQTVDPKHRRHNYCIRLRPCAQVALRDLGVWFGCPRRAGDILESLIFGACNTLGIALPTDAILDNISFRGLLINGLPVTTSGVRQMLRKRGVDLPVAQPPEPELPPLTPDFSGYVAIAGELANGELDVPAIARMELVARGRDHLGRRLKPVPTETPMVFTSPPHVFMRILQLKSLVRLYSGEIDLTPYARRYIATGRIL